MNETGATSISGYATDVNWLDWEKPALALELLLFGLLSGEPFINIVQGLRDRLMDYQRVMNKRFPECKFRMLVRQ